MKTWFPPNSKTIYVDHKFMVPAVLPIIAAETIKTWFSRGKKWNGGDHYIIYKFLPPPLTRRHVCEGRGPR